MSVSRRSTLMPCSPNQRSANQEVGRGPALLVAEHLRVHQPAAVVDGHVQHLPTNAALLAGAIAMDAMSRPTHDASELLGVAKCTMAPGVWYS